MKTNLLLPILVLNIMGAASCSKDDGDEPPCTIADEVFSFRLPENTSNGTVVGNAVIPDIENVSYTFMSGNDANAFAINSSTGEITIADQNQLDYETTQSYALAIEAVTPSCGSSEISVTIAIDNVSEPYVDIAYADITIQKDLMYGSDADQNMWVYTPNDDSVTPRPVMIIAGGGRFAPSNLDVLQTLATRVAKAGYLVATIRYHSDPDAVGDSVRFARSVIASHDIKAAVRYFRKDAATDNLFNVDPDNIFIGGHGTGAFLALFATYGKLDDVPGPFQPVIAALGGIDGNRGNEGYSSATRATFALSGAVIGDLTLIDSGENPAVMIHGLQDAQVSCSELDNNFGSCLIADRMDEVGIPNRLILMPNGNHGDTQSCQSCFDEALSFLSHYLE